MRSKTMRLLGWQSEKMTSPPSTKKIQHAIFLAATISLLSTNVPQVQACGPFNDYSTFVLEQNPDYPLRRYAAGQLGLIRPGYARSYLVVAYRYFSGIKTPPEKQKEIIALWERRLTNPEGALERAVEQWAVERKKVQSAPLKDVEVYKWDPYSSSFVNYNADAFRVATETLKSKISKFGVTDKKVKEWVLAQDQIFGVGAPDGALDPLPADADAESRADRNYQIACNQFYVGHYDEAIMKFQEIAKDSTSRWHQWGNYLAARAYCRKATVGDTPVVADLKHAEVLIDQILNAKDQSPLFQQAKDIKGFIEYRLDPSARAKDTVAALMSAADNTNLSEALGDYTIILDKIQEKKEESEQTPTTWNNGNESDKISSTSAEQSLPQLTKQSIDGLKRASIVDREFIATGVALVAFLFAGAHLMWWRSKKGIGPHVINTIAVFLSVAVLSCSIASCAQKADTTTAAATAVDGKDVPADPPHMTAAQVVLDDEMTNWILNFQDKKPQATEKAVSQWKKSNSLTWLVSAMGKISHTDASKDDLVAAAEKVSSDSPAYTTLAYHRIRLLGDAGKPKEASEILWSILKGENKNMPPSTRNSLYELGVGIVGSMSEFSKLAAPSPACVCAGDEVLPDQVKNLEKAEGTNNFLVYQERLTPQAANIVNEVAPISVLTALANDQTLPVNVRSDIAQSAWVRSVMLKDEKSAMTLSPVLTKLLPQLTKSLTAYNAAASGDEKEFAGLSTILHNPAMSIFVTSGLPRETAFDKIDNYRDNWWCQNSPVINHNYETDDAGKPKKHPAPAVAFLTAEEKTQGLKQCADLQALGSAPNLFAKKILRLAQAKPKDPRYPEVLHLVVTSTRYGCTDETTTPLSKQVFQLLHKNYPGNQWTTKTKFWF